MILPRNVPTAFWQYPGSLGSFLSMHGDGGGGVGGMGGGQRGAHFVLHARTAGSVKFMLGQVPPRSWHLSKQGQWISMATQPGLGVGGGGGLGGMGGGQRGAHFFLHARTAGSVKSMLGQVPPRAWHCFTQGHWISTSTQPGSSTGSSTGSSIGSGGGAGGGGDGAGGGGAGVAT